MRLSARLSAIAHMIPEGYPVVDIGCDHALLDIYLTLNQKNKCIASDMRPSVIAIAKKNIASYQLENKIELIESDGLQNIIPPDHAVVVIAGMGTSTILSILKNPKINYFSYLVIQTNNDWDVFRKQLSHRGFRLVEEQTVLDKNKYYVLMKWQKGKCHYNRKQCFLGPCLMKNKANQTYYETLLEQYHNVDQRIPFYDWHKKIRVKLRIYWLKKELKVLKHL